MEGGGLVHMHMQVRCRGPARIPRVPDELANLDCVAQVHRHPALSQMQILRDGVVGVRDRDKIGLVGIIFGAPPLVAKCTHRIKGCIKGSIKGSIKG